MQNEEKVFCVTKATIGVDSYLLSVFPNIGMCICVNQEAKLHLTFMGGGALNRKQLGKTDIFTDIQISA